MVGGVFNMSGSITGNTITGDGEPAAVNINNGSTTLNVSATGSITGNTPLDVYSYGPVNNDGVIGTIVQP